MMVPTTVDWEGGRTTEDVGHREAFWGCSFPFPVALMAESMQIYPPECIWREGSPMLHQEVGAAPLALAHSLEVHRAGTQGSQHLDLYGPASPPCLPSRTHFSATQLG